jgi:hypothetical protein
VRYALKFWIFPERTSGLCVLQCVTELLYDCALLECINYIPWRWPFNSRNMLQLRTVSIKWWFNNIWGHVSVFIWFNGFLCCSPNCACGGDVFYNSALHIKTGCQPQKILFVQSTHATCSVVLTVFRHKLKMKWIHILNVWSHRFKYIYIYIYVSYFEFWNHVFNA